MPLALAARRTGVLRIAIAQATPMTYEGKDGTQYVVIAATGGSFFGNPVTGDSLMAFALRAPAPPPQESPRR